MDVDVFEGGWENLTDDNSYHAHSTSSAGGSSNVLSPSLQSYLNANDPSWVAGTGGGGSGGGSGWQPSPQHRDPTAIYRAEIARIGRRFGLNNRAPGGRNPRTSRQSVDRRSARSATLLYHQRVRAQQYTRSGHDGTLGPGSETSNRKRRGIGPHRSYQVEGFLEQRLDGGVALTGSRRLGIRSGRRSIGLAPHLTEDVSIWDSPAPARTKVRSAGPTRSVTSRHAGFSSQAPNLWGDTISPSDGQAADRRPSTAPAVGGLAVGQAGKRSRSPGGFSSGGARQNPLVGGTEGDRRRLPGLSRSTSPSAPSLHTRKSTSIFCGPRGKEGNADFTNARRQSDFVPVRALLLLSDWSIGHEVSAVLVSPFDSVSFLRATIQADIMHATISNNAGHRHGHCGFHGCPPFAFSYADGVAIDRGQEERLSVKDIAIRSSATCTVTDGPQWEVGNESGEIVQEMHVFLRACEPRTKQATTDDGAGMLHRWDSLQGGCSRDEVFLQAPSSGSPDSSSSSFFDSYGSRRGGNGYGFSGPRGGVPLGVDTGSMNSSSLATGGAHQHQPRQHQSKRLSVSFDESKAKRRRLILEQVMLLAASKVTLITKVFRGYTARSIFKERLELHRGASKIQMCVRRRAAKQELSRRARRREKAVKIQSLARSRKSKRQASLRREQRDAATRIQSSVRSKAAKEAVKQRQEQRWREEEIAREKARQAEEEMRARGHAERVALEETERMTRLKEEEENREKVARELAKIEREKEEASAIVRIQSLARLRGAKKEVAGRRERKKVALLKEKEQREEAALKLQRLSRVRAAKIEAAERRKRKEAANRIQLTARQRAARKRAHERREALKLVQQRKVEEKRQAAIKIQAAAKGKRDRARVRDLKSRRQDASIKISALARGRRARRRVSESKQEHKAAIVIQRTARGRRGRNRAQTRADQQLAARREKEKTAAIKTQKVARGKSKRALLFESASDLDLYGTKSDARECAGFAGAAPSDKGSDLKCEPQQGSAHSQQRGDYPKRVGFAIHTSASEEAAALVALDLDEHVRSFVAVQATVRRCEAKAEEAAASRRAPPRSEKNDTNDVKGGHNVQISAESDNESEREQEYLSESDFAMSLSLSESAGQDTREDEQEEGWKSDFEVDFKSDFALDDTAADALVIPEEAENRMDKPHDDNAETRESLTRGGREAFNSGNQDGESEGGLVVLEGVQMREDEEHEDQARLSDNGSEEDGASVIAAELTEVAIWEAKVALFLESRAESTQEEEASEPSALGDSIVARGASADGEIPISTESAGAVSEKAVFATMDDETLPSEADTISTTVKNTAAGSLESTTDTARGDGQRTASDALVDAAPETGPEQPAPAAEALVEGGSAVPAVDLDAVGEASASDAMPTPFKSDGVDAMLPADEALNELGGGDTALAEKKTEATATLNGMAGSMASAQIVEPGDVQSAAGFAVVDAVPETNPKKPVPSADPPVEDIEVMSPVDLNVANEPNVGDGVPKSAESARVLAEQPTVEAVPELESGDMAPVEVDTTTSASNVDRATSLESGKVVELGENQPPSVGVDELMEAAAAAAIPENPSGNLVVTDSAGSSMAQSVGGATGDALIDAGPQAEAEQPVPSDEAFVEGNEVVLAVDPDVVIQEANAAEASPMSAVSTNAVAGQPAVEETDGTGSRETAPTEANTTTPAVGVDPLASLDSNRVADLDEVWPNADDVLIDAGHGAAPKGPAPTTEALAYGGAAVLAADPDAAGEASINDVMPTPAESAEVDNEQPMVEPANELGSGNTDPVDGSTEPVVAKVDTAGSTETAQVVDPDAMQLTAGDALVDAGSETEVDQPVPAAEVLAEGDGVVGGAEPSAAEGANAGEEIPTAAESVEVDAGRPAVEAANEPREGETAPVEADTTTPNISFDSASLESDKVAELDEGVNAGEAIPTPPESVEMDAEQLAVRSANELTVYETITPVADTSTPAVRLDPAAFLESTTVADRGDIQPTAGDAEIDADRETEAEQRAPTAEALAEGDEVMPAAGPVPAEGANAAEAIPTSAEPVEVDVEQPAFGPAKELTVDETITPVADTVTPADSTDSAASLESTKVADNADVQLAAGDPEIDAGNEAEIGQLPLAAEALVEGGAAVPASDPDAAGQASINDVMPTSPESAEVDTEQLADEAANKAGSGGKGPADASTESAVAIVDTAASTETAQVVETDEMQPTAGDALVDAGPETEVEPSAPPAKAVADGDGVVLATEPGATEGSNAAEAIPTANVLAGADAEQPVVEAADEPANGATGPAESDIMTLAVSINPSASIESTTVAELDDIQSAASDVKIGAGPETEGDQAVPAAEALVEADATVPVANSDAAHEGTNAGDAVPTSAESVGAGAEQPVVVFGGDNAPAEADTVTAAVDSDAAGSLESAQLMEPGAVQSTPGDALIDAGPETEAKQPVPETEVLTEGGAAVAAADCSVAEEGNPAEVIPMADVSAAAGAEQPVVDAANELAIDATTFSEAYTVTPAVSIDSAASLESTKVAELGDVQPAAGDALIDVGLDTEVEAEQPIPTAEALAEVDAAVPEANLDFAEEANAGEAISTSAEAAGGDAEQPAVEEAKAPGRGETVAAEADITTAAVGVDTHECLESTTVAEVRDVQSVAGDALVDASLKTEAEPEQPIPTAEALVDGDGVVPAADPNASNEGANEAGSISTPAESTGLGAEQPAVKADADTALAKADKVSAVVDSDVAGSLESAQVVEPGETQPTAGDVIVNAGPETDPEQAVLSIENKVRGDAMTTEADPDTAGTADAGDVTSTVTESAGAGTAQPVDEANELGIGDAAPTEADTAPSVINIDAPGSLKSFTVSDLDCVQAATGDAVVHAGPETDPEQPVPSTKDLMERGAAVAAVDLDPVGEESTSGVMPTFAEVRGVDVEQPPIEAMNDVEVVNHIGNGDTAPEEAKTESTVLQPDEPESLESAHEVEPGETHATADVVIGAGRETEAEPEQSIPAAEALVERGAAVPAADSDAVGEASASEVMPRSVEEVEVDAEQPVVEARKELDSGDTPPAEAVTTTPAISVPLESAHEVEPGELHPTAGDEAMYAGPETEAEQPVPAAEALAEGNVAWPATDIDATEKPNAGEPIPIAQGSEGVDAKQPVVGAGNGMPPAEADTSTSAPNVDRATSLESGKVVEHGENQAPSLGVDEVIGVEAAAATPEDFSTHAAVTEDLSTHAAVTDTIGLPIEQSVGGTAGKALVEAGPETEAEQRAPTAEDLGERDGLVPAADPGVAEGAKTCEAIPTAVVSDGTDAEPPAFEAANELTVDETSPAEADTTTAAVSIDSAVSSESAKVTELVNIQPTARDAHIHADPATVEKAVPAAGALADGDEMVPAATPDVVQTDANAGEANPLTAESAEVDAEQPAVEAASEPGSGYTAPAEADTMTPAVSNDTATSLESSEVTELCDVQPATRVALIGNRPKTEPEAEQPVPTAEALAEDDAAVPEVDPGANAGEATPSSAEAAGVHAEQSVVEAATELGSGDTARAETDTNRAVINTDTAGSLESTHESEPDDVPHVTSNVDAGAETEAEQPFVAAETLMGGDGGVSPADLDTAGRSSAGDAVSVSAESGLVSTEQPAVEAANELRSSEIPAEVDTTTSASNVDLATSFERGKIAEPGEDQPPLVGVGEQIGVGAAAAIPEYPSPSPVATDTVVSPIEQIDRGAAGDTVIDADPETEAVQPVPAAETLAGGDGVVLAVDPDAVKEGSNAAETIPSSTESAHAEQPAFEAANELTVGETAAPAEAGTMTQAVDVDPAESSESAKVVERGDGHPTAGNTLVDAGHETETGQPVPAAEALVEGGAAVPAADLDAVKEAKEGAAGAESIPASAEAAGVDAEQLADEAVNEPESGDTDPADVSTESVEAVVDTAASTETAQVVETDEMQPTAGDALVDAGPEAEAEQPAPAAEAVADGDGVVPAAEPSAAEGANADEAISTANASVGADAEQAAVEAANAPGSGDSAPAESDITTPAVSIDPAASLEGAMVAELGEIQSAAGDVVIDGGPEPEAEQPVLAAEDLVEDIDVVPTADLDTAIEANTGDVVESAQVSAEQPTVEEANELVSGDRAPAEVETSTSASDVDLATSLESGKVVELVKNQLSLVGVDELMGVESTTATPENPPANAMVTDTAGSPIEKVVEDTAGIVPIDANPETVEQPVPAPDALGEHGVAEPEADPDSAKKEASNNDVMPMPAKSAGVDAEQPEVEPANKPGSGDMIPAGASMESIIATAGSTETAKVVEPSEVQPTAADALVDAGLETEAEQPVLAPEGDGVVLGEDPGTTEGANAAEAIPTSGESVEMDVEQPAVEAAKELTVDETTTPVTDTSAPAASIDPVASLESTRVADRGDVQPAAGDAAIDAGPETEARQPVPAAEALVEGGAAVPASDPDAAGEASINGMVPAPAESAEADNEQPAVEPANEPGSGNTDPVDGSMEPVIAIVDTAGSTETTQVVDPDEKQLTAGDALVDASPETEAEQPAPAAEVLVDGDGVVGGADPDAAEGVNVGEEIPTSGQSVEVDAEQPAVEAASEPGSGETAAAEADTTTRAVSVDPAASVESPRVADCGDVHPDADDVPIDAGPETAPKEPAPAAKALAGGGAAAPASDPDTAGEASINDVMPAESAGVDNEQPAVEPANEPGSGVTDPADASTEPIVAIVDTTGSTETAQVVEPDEMQLTASDALVDVGPETDADQPVPAAEVLAERDGVLPGADPSVAEGANAGEEITTSAELVEVDAEQPAIEAANEPRGGETATTEANTTTPDIGTDPAASLENTKVAELDEVQPVAGDALFGAGPETEAEAEQPTQTAEGDEVMPAADSVPAEGVNAAEAILTSGESAEVDAEELMVEAANELGSDEATPAVAGSLDSAKVAELGELQATAGDAMVDAGPQTEPEQPAPTTEAFVEGDAIESVMEPGTANEEANANEAIRACAESARLSGEQAAVEAANELGNGNMAPLEVDITTQALANDTGGLLDAANAVKDGEIELTSVVVDETP